MSEIVEQTKILTDEQAAKIVEEFDGNPNVIKGNCFDNLLDNIDKSRVGPK